MGDRHDGARVLGQVALQPRHRLCVEMVGGLVEQQQIRRFQQQPAQRHAAALAARERAHGSVGRRQAQRVHRVFELGLEVPRARRVDLGLNGGELVRGLIGVVGRQLVEAIQQRLLVRHALLDVAAHVLVLVEHRLLRQHAHARPRRERRLAAKLLIRARHDPQQR